MQSQTTSLQRHLSTITSEKSGIKSQIKDLTIRESRLLQDCSDLEMENSSLHKQLSILRTAQVEFESNRHDILTLETRINELQGQCEELKSLKCIAERQLENALETLQVEREQRYALKKELEGRIKNDSLAGLGQLALSIAGNTSSE